MTLPPFSGRKPPKPTEIEIALNAHALEETWNAIGHFCVKRRYGDYGVALETTEEEMPVRVHPRGETEGPLDLAPAEDQWVKRFATWWDAAAAGWQVD